MNEPSKKSGLAKKPMSSEPRKSADEVHTDDVEGVVVSGLGLQPYRVAAPHAGDETDHDRCGTRTRSRRQA